MNKIRNSLVPATAGTLALLAASLTDAPLLPLREVLKFGGSPGTFGSLPVVYPKYLSEGTVSLATFYQELFDSQQELGPEITEAILTTFGHCMLDELPRCPSLITSRSISAIQKKRSWRLN
jgi:hypothetical protein